MDTKKHNELQKLSSELSTDPRLLRSSSRAILKGLETFEHFGADFSMTDILDAEMVSAYTHRNRRVK